ncbi:MAG TPA: folate family ECF transporter S component [Clostridiales bacterium]|nr:folate family ECF transporter S component [Clostridiales bacterium]
MSKIKKIVISGLLLALLIVLSRFVSIKTQILVISFSFIPIIMSAIWLGPKYSTLIAMLGDLIGALLFPFGTYFIGYTISQALTGFVYGMFLYKKGEDLSTKELLIRLTISSLIVLILINVFLTSLWIHIQYGKAYIVIMTGRIVAQICMFPIQLIVIYALEKYTRPIVKKYLM